MTNWVLVRFLRFLFSPVNITIRVMSPKIKAKTATNHKIKLLSMYYVIGCMQLLGRLVFRTMAAVSKKLLTVGSGITPSL